MTTSTLPAVERAFMPAAPALPIAPASPPLQPGQRSAGWARDLYRVVSQDGSRVLRCGCTATLRKQPIEKALLSVWLPVEAGSPATFEPGRTPAVWVQREVAEAIASEVGGRVLVVGSIDRLAVAPPIPQGVSK